MSWLRGGGWSLTDWWWFLRMSAAERAYWVTHIEERFWTHDIILASDARTCTGTPYLGEEEREGVLDRSKVLQQSSWLGYFGFRQVTACLHRFSHVSRDDPFHTHQARWGYRWILAGGYVEEVWRGGDDAVVTLDRWGEGRRGFVWPKFSHRLVRLFNNAPCYTLWLRSREIAHPVTFRWPDGHERVVAIRDMI